MSLRKVSVHVERRGLVFRTWRFYFTKTRYFVLGNDEYERAYARVKESGLCSIGRSDDRLLWWTSDAFYWADQELSCEDVELLIWDRQRRQTTKIERLRKIRHEGSEGARSRRDRIPDDVRAFVWDRDEGRCVNCGSTHELQFDHIIPVAKGGGNSPENVQLLCGDCNRQKGDSIV